MDDSTTALDKDLVELPVSNIMSGVSHPTQAVHDLRAGDIWFQLARTMQFPKMVSCGVHCPRGLNGRFEVDSS